MPAQSSLPLLEEKRSCGGCVACCDSLNIAELEKPAGVMCGHCSGHGCNVHGQPDMPEVCAGFQCLWLAGMGTEEQRPDRCGIIAWKAPDGMLVLTESAAGRFQHEALASILAAIRRWQGLKRFQSLGKVKVEPFGYSHTEAPANPTAILRVARENICQHLPIKDRQIDWAEIRQAYE